MDCLTTLLRSCLTRHWFGISFLAVEIIRVLRLTICVFTKLVKAYLFSRLLLFSASAHCIFYIFLKSLSSDTSLIGCKKLYDNLAFFFSKKAGWNFILECLSCKRQKCSSVFKCDCCLWLSNPALLVNMNESFSNIFILLGFSSNSLTLSFSTKIKRKLFYGWIL